jgi:hypothetical protein
MKKTFVALGLGLALCSVAFAQQKSAKEQILGAWTLVSVTSEMDDGKKGEPFGPSPKGVIIFSNEAISRFFSRARRFRRLRPMIEPRPPLKKHKAL